MHCNRIVQNQIFWVNIHLYITQSSLPITPFCFLVTAGNCEGHHFSFGKVVRVQLEWQRQRIIRNIDNYNAKICQHGSGSRQRNCLQHWYHFRFYSTMKLQRISWLQKYAKHIKQWLTTKQCHSNLTIQPDAVGSWNWQETWFAPQNHDSLELHVVWYVLAIISPWRIFHNKHL